MVIDAVLDAIGGAAFKTVFDGIVEELFQADWAEAKTRLGRDPLTSELARTHAQRRADALVVMARRAHVANPSAAARLRPLVVVVAGLDAPAGGLAELWNETPLSPRQLARILAYNPDLERYLYGPGQSPIADNERHRFFTGKLRPAIQICDRHCTARDCDRPAESCDIDHTEPAPTTDASPATPTTEPDPTAASTATPTPRTGPGLLVLEVVVEEGVERSLVVQVHAGGHGLLEDLDLSTL